LSWLAVFCLSAAMLSTVAGPALAKAAGTTTVRSVSAESGWQETYMTLTAGQKFTITYMSGTWTVDARSIPWVGPEGYSTEVDGAIYQDCKYDASSTYGVLYGQVNGEAANGAFRIGTGGTFTASRDGELYLRINDIDQCLVDNAGSVTVQVQTGPSSQGDDFAFFTWLNACVSGQLGDGCRNDALGIAGVSADPTTLADCAESGAEAAHNGKLATKVKAAYTCLGGAAGALKQYWEQNGK
jgi:hypothetical protein